MNVAKFIHILPPLAGETTRMLVAGLSLLCTLQQCLGQGALQITFDSGSSTAPRGSMVAVGYYSESGVGFGGFGPGDLILAGGGISGYPEDGSAYLQITPGGKLAFSFVSNSHFDLVSFDAAGYSTGSLSPVILEVVGYHVMGVTVTNYFTVDSLDSRRADSLPDFQTFYPNSQFQDVYRVDVLTDAWSLDNVVFGGVVPEPYAGGLILFGTACAVRYRRPRQGSAHF